MKDRLNLKQIEIAFFHTDCLHFELLAFAFIEFDVEATRKGMKPELQEKPYR